MTAGTRPVARRWTPTFGSIPQRFVVVGEYIAWLAWESPTDARPSVCLIDFAIYGVCYDAAGRALPWDPMTHAAAPSFAEATPEVAGCTEWDGMMQWNTAPAFAVSGDGDLNDFCETLRTVYSVATEVMGGRGE